MCWTGRVVDTHAYLVRSNALAIIFILTCCSAIGYDSMRVDEGRMGYSLVAIKLKAFTAVGTGGTWSCLVTLDLSYVYGVWGGGEGRTHLLLALVF